MHALAGMGGYMRLAKIVAAYLAASLAAGCIVAVPIALIFQSAAPPELVTLPLRGLAAGIGVALLAAVPAAAVIYYAEVEGHHAPRFYAGAGALTGVVSSLGWWLLLGSLTPVGWRWPTVEAAATMGIAVLLFAGAGLVGGLTYWAIAGRSAGAWSRTVSASRRHPAAD